MKPIFRLIVFIALSVLLFSCKTTDTIKILGMPKTEIYTPEMKKIATINDDGFVDVKFSKRIHYPFLMSRNPDSDDYVPFALDYREYNYAGKQTFGWTLGLVSYSGLLGGLLTTVIDGTTGGASLLAIAALALPATYLVCRDMPLGSVQTNYNFKYPSEFKTNQESKFVDFVDDGYIKNISKKNDQAEKNSSTSEINTNILSSSKSIISLKDYGKQVEGEYIGVGKLIQNDAVIESFDNIKVTLKRNNKNHVFVEVQTNDGLGFFASESSYEVKKSDKDGWMLIMEEIPDAQIQIDNAMNLLYKHPRVNIDGEIYILEISAKKR